MSWRFGHGNISQAILNSSADSRRAVVSYMYNVETASGRRFAKEQRAEVTYSRSSSIVHDNPIPSPASAYYDLLSQIKKAPVKHII